MLLLKYRIKNLKAKTSEKKQQQQPSIIMFMCQLDDGVMHHFFLFCRGTNFSSKISRGVTDCTDWPTHLSRAVMCGRVEESSARLLRSIKEEEEVDTRATEQSQVIPSATRETSACLPATTTSYRCWSASSGRGCSGLSSPSHRTHRHRRDHHHHHHHHHHH